MVPNPTEEDDFEYGSRSTRSEVKSVTLSDNHAPTIILLENFVYESLIRKCLGVLFVCNNMIMFWT